MLEVLGDYRSEDGEETYRQGTDVMSVAGEPVVDSNADAENVSTWGIKSNRNNGPFLPDFSQTRAALTEGAVVNMSVGLRLDQTGLDVLEVLELVGDRWQVVQAHPFEIGKDYLLIRKNSTAGFPNEVRFSSHRRRSSNGKKSMRFYVGDRFQEVASASRLGITFPQLQKSTS